MLKSILSHLPFLLFLVTTHHYCLAQGINDPFAIAAGQSIEVPFNNIGELPEFKSFVTDLKYSQLKIPYVVPFDLKSLMATRNRMFILDARERYEYEVSHIQGAKRVGYEKFTVEKVWMLDRNTTIIVYSTSEKRARHIASYLKMMGFIDVREIKGGLIGWMNAGYSVVDKEGHDTNNIFIRHKREARKLKKGKAIYK